MIDTHLHLVQYQPDELPAQIEAWRAQQITGLVAVSTDLRSAHQTLEWKRKYPDLIYAAVGYHPEQAPPSEKELAELLSLLHSEREQIAAVGEVGLPHYALDRLGASAPDAHAEALAVFADAAAGLNLPIILHAVHDKARRAYEILQQQQVVRAHFHWLKARADVLHQIVQAGYYVSVTPDVCDRARDRELALQVPRKQLLLETDGPWAYGGRFEGRATTPLLLHEVVADVAALLGVDGQELANLLTENAKRLYGPLP